MPEAPPFLSGLFDYAGMFPPAALPFREMLAEAEAHSDALQYPALIGNDLVLGKDALLDLTHELLRAHGFSPRRPAQICVVGLQFKDLEADHALLMQWERGALGHARITNVEWTFDVADPVLESLPQLAKWQAVRHNLEPTLTSQDWPRYGSLIRDILRSVRALDPQPALKLRCAGPREVDVDTLTHLVQFCAREGIPLKLTQGLHYPYHGTNGSTYGFLEVLAALRLVELDREVSDSDVKRILEGSVPVTLHADGIQVGDRFLSPTTFAKPLVPFAIGSCSIREPDDAITGLLTVESPRKN